LTRLLWSVSESGQQVLKRKGVAGEDAAPRAVLLERRGTGFGLVSVRKAHGGRQQEATMSLLFWYLPLMIMSGAFDSLYRSNEAQMAEVETRKQPQRAQEAQCRLDF
jgi:hypothetical protein